MGADINTTVTTAILAEHAAEIRRLGKRVVADVVEIGKLLGEAKRIAGRSNFLPWLKREFGWSEDTAENFIRLSKLSHQIPKLSELNIPLSGRYLLAAPTTLPEARDVIIERAKAGEPVLVDEVKETIETVKGRRHPAKRKSKPTEVDLEAWNAGDISTAKGQRRGINTRPAKPARDDIGTASTSETARKDAEIEELRNAKRMLEIKIKGLESEIEDLKATAKPAGEQPLTVLIELLRQIIEDAEQPAWSQLLTPSKQKSAQDLMECLQANLHQLVTLRSDIGKAMPDVAPSPHADDGIPPSLRRAVTA